MTPEVLALVGLVLAGAAVIGSLLPGLPGGLLSIAGVTTYWYATGEPGWLVLAALIGTGVVTVAVDWLGGIAAARVGGASTRVAVVAGAVGLALFFLTGTGPIGLFVGVAGTVFLAEYRNHGDSDAAVRSAAYTTVGMLATNVVQALLTLGVFLGLLAVVVV